jgi:hypothetical protein
MCVCNLEQVSEALVSTFLTVDQQLSSTVLPAFRLGFYDLCRVGCCAIVAAVTDTHVVVANGAPQFVHYVVLLVTFPPTVAVSSDSDTIVCFILKTHCVFAADRLFSPNQTRNEKMKSHICAMHNCSTHATACLCIH